MRQEDSLPLFFTTQIRRIIKLRPQDITASHGSSPSSVHKETGSDAGSQKTRQPCFFYFLPLPLHAPSALLPQLPSIILSSSLTVIIILHAASSLMSPNRRPHLLSPTLIFYPLFLYYFFPSPCFLKLTKLSNSLGQLSPNFHILCCLLSLVSLKMCLNRSAPQFLAHWIIIKYF